jgi:hypothetical protein
MAIENKPSVATPVAPSLQAGLDQLEAGIMRAHELLDQTAPRSGEAPEQGISVGAEDALRRCQDKVEGLNMRLEHVVGAVGQL